MKRGGEKRLGITPRRKSGSGRKRGGICWERSVLLWAGSSLRGGSILYSLSRIVTPSQGFLILPPNILIVLVLPILPVPLPFLYFFPPISFSEDDHEPSGNPSHLDQAISSSVDTKLVSLRFLPKKTQHTASTIQKLCVWIFTNCENFELSSVR